MPGGKKPMQLNLVTGGKHWTKKEIEDRTDSEVQPNPVGIAAPTFLTAKQKKAFDQIAGQLKDLGIMGVTDCDTLARYVTAQDLYTQAVKDLRALQKLKPKNDDPKRALENAVAWVDLLKVADRRIDRYYKQATNAASALGLTITSRCKLVVPKVEEPKRENKFAQFGTNREVGSG